MAPAFPALMVQCASVSESAHFEEVRDIAFFGRFPETQMWEAVRIGGLRTVVSGEEAIAEESDDSTL